jgi:hypothetical protein
MVRWKIFVITAEWQLIQILIHIPICVVDVKGQCAYYVVPLTVGAALYVMLLKRIVVANLIERIGNMFEPCGQCEDDQRNVGSGYPGAPREYDPDLLCHHCSIRWEQEKSAAKFGYNDKDEVEPTVIEFTVKCKMRARWVPHFIGMLKLMQNLGGLGGSRMIQFYSDGDGDYRPKFEFEDNMPEPAPGVWKMDNEEICYFDAG